MKKRHLVIYVGALLVLIYLVLVLVPSLQIEWLGTLQENQSYKRWSGVLLLTYIAVQWTLSYIRVKQRFSEISEGYTEFHKWLGALSPLFLFIHTQELGYAYTAWFAYGFLANIILGLINTDNFDESPYWYYLSWMVLHVALSLYLTIMVFYHVFIVFYYK